MLKCGVEIRYNAEKTWLNEGWGCRSVGCWLVVQSWK
jgi:hypothetical protein